ncbi:MAG: 50S ribosomal protein L18 [Planctomycetota bacterium]|nr:MAG: 50S ribosomal protein L18 [Planctomycetota bacterium]
MELLRNRQIKKRQRRQRRHYHIRHKVVGTHERLRLAVFKSNKHIYCQIFNDMENKCLCGVSTLTPSIRQKIAEEKEKAKKEGKKFTKTDQARLVGEKIAELAKEKGVEKVCFDRGGFKYHGRIKALADSARKGGLQF